MEVMVGDLNSDKPVRVQLSRRKGWRMPANTVKVTRPGKWGNPFIVTAKSKPGTQYKGAAYGCIAVPTLEDAIACYREMLTVADEGSPLANELAELTGKNLACWCALTDEHGNPVPCHADVLLELANSQIERRGVGL